MNTAKKANVLSLSGGADSTATLLLMIDKKIHFDEAIYFDEEEWAWPQIKDNINKLMQITNKVTILKSDNSFEYMLKHYQIKKGKRKGEEGLGFPTPLNRWCTHIKLNTVMDYISNKYMGFEITQCIGYTYDEKRRAIKAKANDLKYRFPLIEYGINSKTTKIICKKNGIDFGGLYKTRKRTGCWCCPLQTFKDLGRLYIEFPKTWDSLKNKEMEVRAIIKKGDSENPRNFRYFKNMPFEALERKIKEKNKRIGIREFI